MTPKAVIFDCDGVVMDSEGMAFDLLAEQLAHAERQALLAALAATDGNRQLAAERLGISRAGFYAKLAQHGLGRRG